MNRTAVSRFPIDRSLLFRLIALAGLLSILSPLSAAVSIVGSPVLSKIPPSACTGTPPSAATSFLSTDSNVTLWFTLAGLTNGDVITASWYRPDGNIVTAYTADVVANVAPNSTSNWFCYSSLNPATDPAGVWTVKVFRNHQVPELINQTLSLINTAPTGDGNSFTGSCGTAARPVPWNGTRISGVSTTLAGTWNTNFGTLVLNIVGNTITGTFPNGGTLTGTVSGLNADGTYRDNTGATGPFHFTLSGTGSAAASCSPSATNLIGNGSFEQPGTTNSYNTYTAPDSTSMPCWTVTSGSVDYVSKNLWQASDGNISLDMDGNSAGTIAQTFATTPGTAYTVSFDLAANPSAGNSARRLQVSALGTALSQIFTFNPGAAGASFGDMKWAKGQVFHFTASSSTTTIEFKSLSDAGSAVGPALDNVCVASGTSPCASGGGGGGGQPGCSYDVRPPSLNDTTGTGLSGLFLVSTAPTCAWTTAQPPSWITLTPSSGTGSGGVGYSLAANPGPARSTTLTMATVSIAVQQAAGSSCTYALDSTSKAISGLQGGIGVTVTVTGSNCAPWTVSIPNTVPWIHPGSSSSFLGSGTVTLVVDANPGPLSRTATVTINTPAGVKTVTVTQDAPPCTYSLSPKTSGNIPASGSSGLSAHVTATGSVCSWFVTYTDVNSQWVHFTSAPSAGGSGNINFTVDANNTTSPRTLALTITGKNPSTLLSYIISQAAGSQNTGPVPVISPGGVVNAASFIPASLPSGAIAQGSFFSIFGSALGPTPSLQANAYPLDVALGNVSVKITQGSTSVDALPVFVAPFQVNAIMPSNTPIGDVQVTVTFNGGTSAPAAAKVVVSNFGAFAVSGGRGPGIVQNVVSATLRPLNAAPGPATPGQYVTLWGTGLGPLPNGASDTQAPAAGSLPVPVTVTVGGKVADNSAQFFYSGRGPGLAGIDQFNFSVPLDAPLGCYVPIQVLVNGTLYSNTVSMAISSDGSGCSDSNPLSAIPRSGGKIGDVALVRLNVTEFDSALAGSLDLGAGFFSQKPPGGALGFDLFASLPPMNTCTYYNNLDFLNGLFAFQLPAQAAAIDAGVSIAIKGPKGNQALPYSDASAAKSPYLGLFGGSGAIGALAPGGPYLDPGSYTISGTGGKDVGPFSFTMDVPTVAAWTNRDQIGTIDRTQGLKLNWSGGNAGSQFGLIAGLSTNSSTKVSGGFGCVVALDQNTFTVPPGNLSNLPPAGSGTMSYLMFITAPKVDQTVKFNTSATPSLDAGYGLYAIGELRTVSFK